MTLSFSAGWTKGSLGRVREQGRKDDSLRVLLLLLRLPLRHDLAQKTYSLDPYIKGLTEAGKKNVYGVECPIWAEYVRDFDKLSYMCFPRFWAVAEAGWTKRANMDYNSFEERFEALRPMLEEMGIKPAPRSDWNPNFLQSLKELRQFFKGTTNLGNILNMIRNNQA